MGLFEASTDLSEAEEGGRGGKMPKPIWHTAVEKPHHPTIGRLLDGLMACARSPNGLA